MMHPDMAAALGQARHAELIQRADRARAARAFRTSKRGGRSPRLRVRPSRVGQLRIPHVQRRVEPVVIPTANGPATPP